MIPRKPNEVLQRLIAALPRCCACEKDVGVVMNEARWWLCEKCFGDVPCSDFKPMHDMRREVYAALTLLANTTASS